MLGVEDNSPSMSLKYVTDFEQILEIYKLNFFYSRQKMFFYRRWYLFRPRPALWRHGSPFTPLSLVVQRVILYRLSFLTLFVVTNVMGWVLMFRPVESVTCPSDVVFRFRWSYSTLDPTLSVTGVFTLFRQRNFFSVFKTEGGTKGRRDQFFFFLSLGLLLLYVFCLSVPSVNRWDGPGSQVRPLCERQPRVTTVVYRTQRDTHTQEISLSKMI